MGHFKDTLITEQLSQLDAMSLHRLLMMMMILVGLTVLLGTQETAHGLVVSKNTSTQGESLSIDNITV